MTLLFHIGRYFLLLGQVFGRPERLSIYRKRVLEEVDLLGVKSLGIVALLSAFMGAVITIQTKTNIDSPLIQAWVVGFATRQSTILEFSPTIISLILAGKVGSNIAAEIGSRALVGSSIKIISGLTAIVLAMQSLCCCPPDRLTAGVFPDHQGK